MTTTMIVKPRNDTSTVETAPPRTIRYATGACSLGRVLVAGSPTGICAVLLADDDSELTADLERRFAGSPIAPDPAGMAEALDAVVRLIEAPGGEFGQPLDMGGTTFQRRVWKALRSIPAGTTASYADIAARLGAPGSARAVARACAANPLAVVVPCHRIVRSDGGVSGYRWGVTRKRALLTREAGC